MQYPENILAQRISEGDAKAFEEAYLRHFHKILYYAVQYLSDKEEARNVAQETFFELWRKRESLDPSLNLLPYLLTITRNKCLNILRSNISRRKYTEYMAARRAEADYAALSDSSAEKLIVEETYNLVKEILGTMPEKTRTAFVLSRREELSYAEIAERMGTSVKMVEYRIMQALKILRARMGNKLLITVILLFNIF